MIYSSGTKISKLRSLGEEVKKAYSFGQLIYTSALYRWLQYAADRNETVTYTWNVSTAEKNYVSLYIWPKYTLISETSYYGDTGWGSEEDYDVEKVTGNTEISFSASSGFSGTGYGTLTQAGTGSDVYSCTPTSATWYYFNSVKGHICRRNRSCSSQISYSRGSFIEDVSSTYSGQYPDGGAQDGYWYGRYSTESQWDGSYRKGSYIGTVSSTNASAYPQNGEKSGNWYSDMTSVSSWDGTYKQGTATGKTATSEERTAYPDNGYQSGYWWVYDGVTQ